MVRGVKRGFADEQKKQKRKEKEKIKKRRKNKDRKVNRKVKNKEQNVKRGKAIGEGNEAQERLVLGQQVAIACLPGRHKRGLRAAGRIRAACPKMKNHRICRRMIIYITKPPRQSRGSKRAKPMRTTKKLRSCKIRVDLPINKKTQSEDIIMQTQNDIVNSLAHTQQNCK